MTVVGRVVSLGRYPVKSLGGEGCEALDLDRRGVAGDRVWAAYTDDGGIGSGKTTRRFRRVDGLLDWTAATTGLTTTLTAPDGRTFVAGDPVADEELGRWTGRSLALRIEADVSHLDESPVHLVTTASLRRAAALAGGVLDPARVRANVLVDTGDADGWVEDAWSGRTARVGRAVVALGGGTVRCRMVDLAPAGTAPGAPVLRALGEHHDVRLGLAVGVLEPGRVRVGDELRLV